MTAPKFVKQCNSCGVLKCREEFPTPRGVKCSECHVSRVCIRCDERKPIEEFPLVGGAKHEGTTNRIRRCHPCYLADRRQDYKQAGRERRFEWQYGITLEERNALLAKQGGKCAICERSEPNGHDWCVDHDHTCCPQKSRSCGKCVRGILCHSCNSGIGLLGDDPQVLSRAAWYIGWAQVQSNVSRMQPI